MLRPREFGEAGPALAVAAAVRQPKIRGIVGTAARARDDVVDRRGVRRPGWIGPDHGIYTAAADPAGPVVPVPEIVDADAVGHVAVNRDDSGGIPGAPVIA